MKQRAFIVAALLLLVLPSMATAQGWIVRARGISVSPNDSSDTITGTGTEVTVDSDVVPELDFTYMLNPTWGLELILATSNHDLATSGGALGGLDAGDVWALPPTLTLQYHFPTSGRVHPYVGAGLNFTLFYDYSLSDDLRAAGVSDIEFDDSIGIAGQVGLDVDFGTNWLLNFDAKYVTISTDAELKLAGGGSLDTVGVDIDPWVIGVGIGYRF